MISLSAFQTAAALIAAAIVGLLMAQLTRLRFPPIYPHRALVLRLVQLGYDPRDLATAVWAALSVSVATCGLTMLTTRYQALTAVVAAVLAGVSSATLKWLIQRRERLLRQQISDAATSMAGVLSAGTAPALAIVETARRAPGPLDQVLGRVAANYRHGAPLPEALRAIDAGLELDAFTFFSSAVCATLERGGRLTEALERISATLRRHQALEEKLYALTASARHAIVTLAAFPLLFFAVFYSIDSHGYELILDTQAGQLLCGGAIVVMFVALRWAKYIVDQVQ